MDKKFREEIEQETKTIKVDNVMDDIDKARLEIIKEETINTLESGSINDPQAQYGFINSKLKELLDLKDKNICSVILKYLEDQKILKQQIESKQKEIQKLMDEYGENVKDIYENLVKKL